MADFYLRDDFAFAELSGVTGAAELLAWAGEAAAAAVADDVFRDKEGRRTVRLRRGGRVFFLKYHSGVGWREMLKNLGQLRFPVIDAGNEYRAVGALHAAGVDTLVVAAYAALGDNPARRRSVIVTDALTGTVSLEDYCAGWDRRPPEPALRMRLLRKLAESARRMHAAGINHRDFYLCHFHLDTSTLRAGALRCYLIDLHRAQQRGAVPRRWRIKDLAGLYFSAMDCGLTQRDLLRFIHHYQPGGLREAFTRDAGTWSAVARRAHRLYGKARSGSGRAATGEAGEENA